MNCSSYNLSYIYLEVFGESATLDWWLNITFLIVFFAGCLMLHGLILLQKCVKRYGSLIVLRSCLCSWRILSLSLSAGFFLEQVADVLCKWECLIWLAKTKQKATKINKSKAFMAVISIHRPFLQVAPKQPRQRRAGQGQPHCYVAAQRLVSSVGHWHFTRRVVSRPVRQS